jgi:PH (Pleckstrin Homology) domain-containing protein
MALVACRECGKMVSTEAATCPECGMPNPTQAATAVASGGHASATNPSRTSFADPTRMTAQESSVYQAHVHWIVYGKAIVVAIVGSALIPILVYDEITPYAAIGVLVVAAILGVVAYMKASSTEFVITSRRLIAKRGIASRRTIETLLEKVEAVTVEQGVMGRMLNYGKVTVIGTGGTNETFTTVADPMHLRQVIHEQIDRARG